MTYNDFLTLINQNTSEQIDYKWLCRFCLEKTNGIDVGSTQIDALTIRHNYYTITNQSLPISDEYPNLVCTLCVCHLSDCASFIQQIVKNDKHWEAYLEKDRDVKFEGFIEGVTEIDNHESWGVESDPMTNIEEIKIEYCENNFYNVVSDSNTCDAFDSTTHCDDIMRNDIVGKINRPPKTKIIQRGKRNFGLVTTTEYERTCKFCNVPTFSSMIRFYTHLSQHHPGEKIFTCDICGSQFNRKERLANHISDRHGRGGRKHQCQYCAKMFFTDRELKGHEQLHLNARNYVCKLCGKRFNQKTSLNIHMKSKVHNANFKTKHKKKVYKYDPMKKTIRCGLCIPSIVFSCIEERTIHRNAEHRKFECDICKNAFMTQESLDSHKLTHSEKPRPFLCTFKSGPTLKDVILVQSSNELDRKKVCNASFCQSSHLNSHFKRKHTENKSFQCSYCVKKFFESSELTVHTKHVHEKQIRVKCDKCSRDFATEKNLKLHWLSKHSTDILRYDCKLCSKRLSNGASLNRHLAIFHS